MITSGVRLDWMGMGGALTGVDGGDTDLIDLAGDDGGELVSDGAPDEEQWPLLPPPRNILSRFWPARQCESKCW